MKRLIVTADDLGLHRGMTEGALIAHETGVVTAVSLSACGRDIEHAIEAVRPYGDLDVGIHFTLVEERPLLPAPEVASLTGRDGRFLSSYKSFAVRWASGKIDLDEVETELRAQAERLTDSGLKLTHANGHQHMHVLPGLVDRVIRVCDSYGIRYVRTPHDASPGWSGLGVRRISLGVLNMFGARARGRLAKAGLATNDCTIGIADSGHLNTDRIERLLPVVSGVTELVTHPGVHVEDLREAYSWRYSWADETAALRDVRLRQAISDHGIELVRPRDLT